MGSVFENRLNCQYVGVQFSPNVLSPTLHLVIDDAVALAGQVLSSEAAAAYVCYAAQIHTNR